VRERAEGAEEDRVVGQVGFNCFDLTDHSTEVGFDLNRQYW
jgi:hypothetical protein